MRDVEELRDVIRHLHKAEPTHVVSVPVKEMQGGTTLWEGIVEVFDLHGHPAAKRVYAWAYETENPKRPQRHKAVLHIGPVVSPQAAVRIAMLQEFGSLGTTEENRESGKVKTGVSRVCESSPSEFEFHATICRTSSVKRMK